MQLKPCLSFVLPSQELPKQRALQSPEFQIVALLGGLLGFGISFTSLW